MKQFLVLTVCILLLSACTSNPVPEDLPAATGNSSELEAIRLDLDEVMQALDQLQQENHLLRRELRALQLSVGYQADAEGSTLDFFTDTDDTEPYDDPNSLSPLTDVEIQVEVTGKSVNLLGANRESVVFTLEITNGYDRTVRGIDGILIIQPLFQNATLRVDLTAADQPIPPGETISVEAEFETSGSTSIESTILKTSLNGLDFDFDFLAVAFEP